MFVWELSEKVRERLETGLRSRETFVMRRCQILLASARGKSPPKITQDLGCASQTVRNAIRAFNDPEPKAVSCYGLYLPDLEETWIRFVDGRPVSSITTQFLEWSCHKLQEIGKKVLLLIWNNARAGTSPERSASGSEGTIEKSSGAEAE